MAVLYPSNEWCEEWKKAINNSPKCVEKGKVWGVDFNGSMVFELLPSDGLTEKTYIYLDVKGGKALESRIINDLSEVDAGFICPGQYEQYKKVAKGEVDFIEGLLRGLFTLKGDMAKIMRNAQFIRGLADSISAFDSEYLGE